jgi:hypothetical protein
VSSAAFCSDCGTRANPNRVTCFQCGGKLPHNHVRENPALYAKVSRELPPAAVFDLDMTIFDNTQRFKDARRAGLIDKEGKAVAKGMMSTGQAWRKRNNFLYSKKNLRKDTVIAGAKELVNELVGEGYTIVYLTGRPETHRDKTVEQLEYFGFPLFRDNKGETLLIMKEKMNAKVSAYKGNALRELSGNYKVEMFFDDDDKALEEAIKLKIPGVYSTVDQRTNPGAGDVYIVEEDIEKAYRMMPDPDDEDDRTVGDTMNPSDYIRANPAKRGKDAKGPYYRWGGGKKYHYKTGNKKSREAARKKAYGQARAAFAGGYKKNPASLKKLKKAEKLYKHMNGQEPDTVKIETIDIGDVWYKVGEGGAWQIGYMSGKETGKENQRYLHTFNEESKDGNFPELYATMPEKGKPMLIIRGGTWKIKTDKKGVAWIYD